MMLGARDPSVFVGSLSPDEAMQDTLAWVDKLDEAGAKSSCTGHPSDALQSNSGSFSVDNKNESSTVLFFPSDSGWEIASESKAPTKQPKIEAMHT
jgi:hypothetical protein